MSTSLVTAVICLLAVVPSLTMADVVIELIDGERMVVPVDSSKVKSIGFEKPRGDETSASTGENTAGASVEEQSSGVKVWRVGAARVLKNPSDAARKAQPGDIIEIDAGTYHNDYATWPQDDITIRGAGGLAHLKSKGLIPNRKAIWILKGNNILIENIEFSGAAVKDTNGAGIRHEGGDLTLRNTFFHDNEFSMLTGKRPGANIEISASRFWFQRRNNRFSHGIYIGPVGRFTLIGSHFKGTRGGHQVKSRAFENHLLYNRIEDVPGGDSSRLVDLPNCGLSFIVGNDLHQGADTQNFNAIGYGHEGCPQRTAAQMRLYVVNNTFVNEAGRGTLVDNSAGGDAIVSNNLLVGSGRFLVGDGEQTSNVKIDLTGRDEDRWYPPADSAAVDSAVKVAPVGSVSLIPIMEFNAPLGVRNRPQDGALDVGSREVAR